MHSSLGLRNNFFAQNAIKKVTRFYSISRRRHTAYACIYCRMQRGLLSFNRTTVCI